MGKSKKSKNRGRPVIMKSQPEPELLTLDLPDHVELPTWLKKCLDNHSVDPESMQRIYMRNACICKSSAKHKENCEGNLFCLKGFPGVHVDSSVYESEVVPLAIALSAHPEGAKAFEYYVRTPDVPGLLQQVRDVNKTPAGLRNLGQTCYMNAFLQSLYSIAPFRELLFKWTPAKDSKSGTENQNIISELQRLFVRMTASEFASADTSRLVSALEIDPKIQQDPHEFARLFLSLIQDQFEQTPCGSAFHSLFEGKAEYKTYCTACCKARDTPNTYSELALPIARTEDTLVESLKALVSPENLTGSNQVRCGLCNKLADASREFCIKTLPPFLNVQLLRFQFDKKKMDKKKKRDKFAFPRFFDFKSFVSDAAKDDSFLYELTAVLVHIGPTADGGHYVCYAQSELGGEGTRWYEFNDTIVTDVTDLVNGLFDEAGARITAHSSNRLQALWSHDAYALVYRRCGYDIAPPVAPEALVKNSADPEDNEAFKFVHLLKEKCEDEQKLVNMRKTLISNVTINPKILAEVPVDRLRFIEIDWLKDFMRHEKCGPIRNAGLLCSHGRLSTNVCQTGKCIRSETWELLQNEFGGGPELSLNDVCPECALEYCRNQASALDKEGKHQIVVDFIKKTSGSKKGVEPEMGYWISKEWLKVWKTTTEMSYSDMTSMITCCHGNLSPDESSRTLVQFSVWSYLSSLAHDAGEDVVEFPGITEPCSKCLEEEEANRQIAASAQKEKKADKEQFASLLKDPHQAREGEFFLVDKAWYDAWKKQLSDSKDTEEIPKFNSKVLLCPHGKMAYNPSDYLSRSAVSSCKFAAVPGDLWKAFKGKYAHPESPEIKLTLSKDEPVFSCDVCYDCLLKEQEKAHEERCIFSSGKVTIIRLPGRFSSPEQVLDSVKKAEEKKESDKKEPPPKRNTRSAATKNTTRTIEGVDSSWSVQGFKMHVFANYDAYLDCGMPEQHVLIFNGEIMDDEKHLSEYGVENGKSSITLGVLKECACGSSDSGNVSRQASDSQLAGFAGSRLSSARPSTAP